MINYFSYAFFQNALIAGIFVSIVCGIIGTYIVVKRMSLISGSIAHSAFGGLGISYFFGFNPLYGAFLFSIFSALSINYSRIKNKKNLDVFLSSLWAVGMSVGLIFMFLTPGYKTDLFTYLFGNILLVSRSDLFLIGIFSFVVVLFNILFYNSFLSIVFDEEFSYTKKLPVNLLYFLLFALIALGIVAVIKVVGIVLLIAILTLPQAAARLFSKSIKKMMILSIIYTFISLFLGLILSTVIDFPPTPVIVIFMTFIYLLSFLAKKINSKIYN